MRPDVSDPPSLCAMAVVIVHWRLAGNHQCGRSISLWPPLFALRVRHRGLLEFESHSSRAGSVIAFGGRRIAFEKPERATV